MSPGRAQKSADYRPIFNARAEIAGTTCDPALCVPASTAARKTGHSQTLVPTISEAARSANDTRRMCATQRRESSHPRGKASYLLCMGTVSEQPARVNRSMPGPARKYLTVALIVLPVGPKVLVIGVAMLLTGEANGPSCDNVGGR